MTLRAAVIGAGHFAYRVHIPVLASRDDVALDSVCRLGGEELARVSGEFGFAFATEDWREVLERPLDIAVVASPHHLHYAQTKALLERGVHVLVEKPMCLSAAEAWELVALAAARERQLLVAYGWHYKPKLDIAREWLDRIGPIEHVMIHMASFTRAVFAGDGASSRWKDVAIQPNRATWQDPERGGGFAWGQLSHVLGLLYWLSGLRAEHVACTAWMHEGIDLHDAATIRFENGGSGSLSGSCGVPEGHGFELDLRFYGRDGALGLDLDRERLILKLPGGRSEDVDVAPGTWAYSCEGPAGALADCAHGRDANRSDGRVGAKVVETLEAMARSIASEGETMTIDRERSETT